MNRTFRVHLPTVTAVIFTIVMLTFTLLWFRNNIDELTKESAKTYLAENTQALVTVFNTKLEDQIVMLESQERYFRDIDISDYNSMKETILSTKGIGAFKTIGVADKAGTTINYNGRTSGNICLTDYFQEAMQGNTALSAVSVSDENGSEVLVAAVPIMQNDVPAGVIYGTFDKSVLSKLIDSASFSGRETNLLIESNGNIITCSTDSDLISDSMTNLFEEINLYKPSSTKDTVLESRINGTPVLVVLTPVGVHDWYFASILPRSVVDAHSSEISDNVAILIMVVSFAFILLFVSILYLLKNNDSIYRNSEKFKMVTVQTQDIIFDYDFVHKVLTLDGNTENVVAGGKNTFNFSETHELLNLIHDDDVNIREQLRNVRNTKESVIRGEFRVKCLDGTYCWFRVKAAAVKVHDQLQQMVGSLINVEEQFSRELGITGKNETDPLTGVLTAAAFRKHVTEKLRTAAKTDMLAVYIIDIDSFKSVNDNLGHTMGDQVLSDVAKKICVVFSDQDCIGRTGGDEFAVLLKLSVSSREIGMKIIESKAAALCEHLRESYSGRRNTADITASVGTAVCPDAGRDFDTLCENASDALHYVKEHGKNSFMMYSPDTCRTGS